MNAPIPGPNAGSSKTPSGADPALGRLARDYLKFRRMRDQAFPPNLFADPAWDILLDLFACAHESREVSISSACIAANVPFTTALRYVKLLDQAGLIERRDDEGDRRRQLLRLTPEATSRLTAVLRASALWPNVS